MRTTESPNTYAFYKIGKAGFINAGMSFVASELRQQAEGYEKIFFWAVIFYCYNVCLTIKYYQ